MKYFKLFNIFLALFYLSCNHDNTDSIWINEELKIESIRNKSDIIWSITNSSSKLFIRNTKEIFCIDIINGKTIWKLQIRDAISYNTLSIYDEFLYIPTDKSIIKVNTENGDIVFEYKFNSERVYSYDITPEGLIVNVNGDINIFDISSNDLKKKYVDAKVDLISPFKKDWQNPNSIYITGDESKKTLIKYNINEDSIINSINIEFCNNYPRLKSLDLTVYYLILNYDYTALPYHCSNDRYKVILSKKDLRPLFFNCTTKDLVLSEDEKILYVLLENSIQIRELNSDSIICEKEIEQINDIKRLVVKSNKVFLLYANKVVILNASTLMHIKTLNFSENKIEEIIAATSNQIFLLFNDHTIKSYNVN